MLTGILLTKAFIGANERLSIHSHAVFLRTLEMLLTMNLNQEIS